MVPELVQFYTAPADGPDVTRIMSADLPASLRRTDTIKFIGGVPQEVDDTWSDFVSSHRLIELQLVGCA